MTISDTSTTCYATSQLLREHHRGSSRIIVDHCGSLWIVVDHCGSLWIIVEHRGSLWIIMDHCGPLWLCHMTSAETQLLALQQASCRDGPFRTYAPYTLGPCHPAKSWYKQHNHMELADPNHFGSVCSCCITSAKTQLLAAP